ncbi:reverse transcriptase family protein [Pseudohongiella nitratireducens]|uniref:reverse transcriptase family protein n=1 Tax=Pseudohongiella nitratireducens TaxID=1768907 RepID=UPI0030EC6C36|tara:strand:- start:4042 stop:5034 length:993 start_codon:yes stop_codon:yes gene_type:complete
MKIKKYYPISQSPFYKLSNHKVLCKILGVELPTLKKILKRGDNNYWTGEVKKDDKKAKSREIEVPKSQLHRIHRRINLLLSRIETPDYLVSGVKGRSHVFNADLHRGDLAVAKADIKKFYPSTNISMVKSGFKKVFRMADDIAETLSKICVYDGHIPTGSPLSQSLSFILNKPIFDHINYYSKSRGLKFSLYVDDLTFSGKMIPKYFLEYLKKYFKKNKGYVLHKFRTYNSSTEKIVTGVVIKGNKLTLKKSQRFKIKKLRDSYLFYSDPAKINEEKTIIFFQRYLGHLFSAAQIIPRYKQIGKRVAKRRSDLGVKALNQHTKKLIKVEN